MVQLTGAVSGKEIGVEQTDTVCGQVYIMCHIDSAMFTECSVWLVAKVLQSIV